MQIDAEVGVVPIVGAALTVIAVLAVLEHPLASVPITVYVVVVIGDAETFAPLPDESPVDGLHT